jgi:hypothetical protein
MKEEKTRRSAGREEQHKDRHCRKRTVDQASVESWKRSHAMGKRDRSAVADHENPRR